MALVNSFFEKIKKFFVIGESRQPKKKNGVIFQLIIDEKIKKVYTIIYIKSEDGNFMSKERRDKIKQKQNRKKLVILSVSMLSVVLVAVLAVGLNFHKCDDCGESFFGRGYYKEKESAGILGSAFGSLFGDTEGIPLETEEGVILCQQCAKSNPSVKAELRNLNEFKR